MTANTFIAYSCLMSLKSHFDRADRVVLVSARNAYGIVYEIRQKDGARTATVFLQDYSATRSFLANFSIRTTGRNLRDIYEPVIASLTFLTPLSSTNTPSL